MVNIRTRETCDHLERFFQRRAVIVPVPEEHRFSGLVDDLRVVEIERPKSVVCASAGLSTAHNSSRGTHEFVIQGPSRDSRLHGVIRLVCYWHLTSSGGAHAGRVLNLESPWVDGSPMKRVLVSLPYPYGPKFERVALSDGHVSRFLWLLPIHDSEADAIRQMGVEAVERRFEERRIQFDDPARPSVYAD